MPHRRAFVAALRGGVLLEILGRDTVDFGEFGEMRRGGMAIQIPKARGEIAVLFARDGLVAEKHDLVIQNRLLDLITHRIADRLREVYTLDLGANGRLQREYVNSIQFFQYISRFLPPLIAMEPICRIS